MSVRSHFHILTFQKLCMCFGEGSKAIFTAVDIGNKIGMLG